MAPSLKSDRSIANLPDLPQLRDDIFAAPVPDENECELLWDKYEMLENVRLHSRMVARVAYKLALLTEAKGIPVNPPAVRAAGLLHDLAKTYCLRYGGGHAALGAAWVVRETRDYNIAQGVAFHVQWPWPLPAGDALCCLPIFTLYADKRVRHDKIVSLSERMADIIKRYGLTEEAREKIKSSMRQVEEIEKRLSSILGIDVAKIRF